MPRLPVRSNFLRDGDLQLLLQRLVPLSVVGGAANPGNTGEPRADVEVVFARFRATDESGRWQNFRKVIENIRDDVLPVSRRDGEEVRAGYVALVDLEDPAIALELLGVEVLEGRPLCGRGVLLERGLACEICESKYTGTWATQVRTVLDEGDRETGGGCL